MRIVAQKVKEAKVMIGGEEFSAISGGMALLVGIAKGDTLGDAEYLAGKIKNLRIFEDSLQKMNLNINQAGGEILSIPQFTLLADVHKGNRPGFDAAEEPAAAKKLWSCFNDMLRKENITVKEGQFGAKMQVGLVNDGPVTFYLDSKVKNK
ncbi:MAG: D-tyrosyl-tRNA(Tyr) deacylase [Candidatus Omnitrophica bacterium]|nr:D-tyrosyl-tRNA(Tyr) deacylase [Candidatus Omnitrophota bacterium]